ncbi:hypothetical protein JOD54_001238 [Actinokineospora baliensis]|nr:hypothetical protein [Actinokineospora baliensis]
MGRGRLAFGIATRTRRGPVGSMGRTWFARGPCATRGRTAKAGAEKHGPAARQGYGHRHPTQTKSAPSSIGWAASWERWLGWRGWLGGLDWRRRLPGSARLRHRDAVRGVWVGSMGRTWFARGPCATRGRTAKLGPKSMALQHTTLRIPPPHTNQVRPIEHWAGGFLGAVAELGGLARGVVLAPTQPTESAHPTQPAESAPPARPPLPEVAGANCSMGRTCFVWGCGARSVVRGQGHAFRPQLCGPATGVVGAPRKTGPPHRAVHPTRALGARGSPCFT